MTYAFHHSRFNSKQTSKKVIVFALEVFEEIKYLKSHNLVVPRYLVISGILAGSCLSQSRFQDRVNLKQTSARVIVYALTVFRVVKYLKSCGFLVPYYLVRLSILAGSCLAQSSFSYSHQSKKILSSLRRSKRVLGSKSKILRSRFQR